MKESGIKWIGTIPEDWKTQRMKSACSLISRGCAPVYEDEGDSYAMNQATFSKGYIDYSNLRFTSKKDRSVLVNNGDLLIASTGGGVLGKVIFTHDLNGTFYADSHVTIIRGKKLLLDNKFLYYFFLIHFDTTNAILAMGSTNQTELQRDEFNAFIIPCPSYDEQQVIANYLDSKCSKIDASIASLSEMKEKYLSLKKSLINETVCRGLNKSVSLKSSGIDLIGDISEHWEVKRIKDLVSVNSKVLSDSTNKNYTFKYIDISSVSSDGNISISEEYSFSEAPSRARRIIKRNDIIVSTVRTYLQAIAQIDWNANDAIVSTGFAVLSPNKKVCSPSYLFYAIKSEVTINEIMRLSIGVSYPAITAYYLCNIPLAIPPLSEQQSIATYLDTQCSKIDSIIENIVSQIEAYTKLKKSLINEVVTGKKRVI